MSNDIHAFPFVSGHKTVTFTPRASAMALRSLNDLSLPLIALYILVRCTPTERAISTPVRSFAIICILIFLLWLSILKTKIPEMVFIVNINVVKRYGYGFT
jgi:hypothetical protein